MLQKKILGIAVFLLAGLILYDLHKAQTVEKDTLSKMIFLESLHPQSEFAKFSSIIKESAATKKSLGMYYKRFLSIDSLTEKFNDSIDWMLFVDNDDESGFGNEISKIPKVDESDDRQLMVVRNKIIYNEFANYILYKVGAGSGGGFFSEHSFFKDLDNNLSLTYNSFSRQREVSSINGQTELPVSYKGLMRVPLADTLVIISKFWERTNVYYSSTVDDTLELRHVLDISDVEDEFVALW